MVSPGYILAIHPDNAGAAARQPDNYRRDSFLQMRQGLTPEEACKKTIERIIKIKKEKVKDIQVAFIALNKKGEVGAFAIQEGFSYAVKSNDIEQLIDAKSWYLKNEGEK